MPQEFNLIIDAINALLELLIEKFGVTGTIAVAVIVYLVIVMRRLYLDYRRDKDSDRAIKAMETSVQRAAQESREWRVLFMKEKAGWDLEDAERMVMDVDFDDPNTARAALEKRSKKTKKQSKSRRKK